MQRAANHFALSMRNRFMTSLEIRRLQLVRLTQTLEDVVTVLELVEPCSWTGRFTPALAQARAYLDEGFTQCDLDEFSRSLCRLLEEIADKSPQEQSTAELPAEGLHCIRNFETFRSAAFMQALQLRAID